MSDGVYIDVKWHVGGGASFAKNCPATGEVSWQGGSANAEDVKAAVASAQAAFSGWARTPVAERISILERYAEELGKRAGEIAEAISRDMGKALWDSQAEAATMKAKIAVSVAALKERAGERDEPAAFGQSRLTHRPHGVMAVFGPFNFPGHLPNGHIVPALLAGNTCVFKPSELAPSVARLMADAFEAAGLPPGCLNIVHGGRDTGAALIDQPINGLLFTGSAATGVFFHKHFAGRPEVILALEMGGNNPLIVWEPADVDAAADIAAQSAYLTTGQRCSCARRLILPNGAFGDKVLEAIIARAKGIEVGAWDEPGIFMGPLVSHTAASQAVAFYEMLLSKGAASLLPLEAGPQGTGFVSPGVVDVTEARDVPDEELFGPLIQIVRVASFDEAIARANASRYGLSGGLVSDDDALWARAYSEMRAGILNRNRPTAGASGAMPFGGPGLSGNFRPGAYYAADYCAWPQASQLAPKAARMTAPGFPS
ncbi:succinylglutamic semialdehyde dehydrogenase [Hyphomonas neptunium ATCC 15444]|uniref:Succinylglutamic semialdehyde dehydrogenase n=2 Tax=Hyphomonas TaxID=85 RepID=Q0C0P8_HYPNA|nr:MULTISPECIES: succinylglutamate-semialdehyde dehydrogenase [Hyphomonas]ABI77505.1 succinylglutamic semialdehyde dehydrogenase [Hyphomonas neptunium ATCC 15444]KCZ88260.1 succinylglutamic semialdehyde dehydrogenase [Hyphomonas hirschiana VP5]